MRSSRHHKRAPDVFRITAILAAFCFSAAAWAMLMRGAAVALGAPRP